MTTQAILSTKISLPHIRTDVVHRPRIVERLNAGLAHPFTVTLISAPAGYGKTTLVVSWLRKTDAPHAWYSLEADDNHPRRFITYVLSALQKTDPAIGKSALQMLEGLSADSLQTDDILSSLIHDLTKLQCPLFLVLEDYHVIVLPEIHAFVEKLIEYAQPHLQIVITTRHDPPLPVAKWRVRDQLTELRTADLQFTLIEATEFLETVMQLQLDPHIIHQLEQQTEGWVAGLQLAALSLRNQPGRPNPSTLTGGQRAIADYLMTEVVRQLPQDRQDFLLQTSLVGHLNASLCNTLTGRTDSQAMLEALEADNLFTLSLNDSRTWFRYHHLFAEFLYKHLQAERPESFVHELHERAAHWLSQNGFVTEAIDHALAAKDFEYAARLIAPQSEQWMRYGEAATILRYLDQLPTELAWREWSLCLWYGWAYSMRAELDLAERWVNRLDELVTPLFQQASQQEGAAIPADLQNGYVQVLGIRSTIARRKNDYALAIALGKQALSLVPESNPNLKAILSTTLSSTMLEAGHFDDTEAILRTARAAIYRVANPFILFSMLMNESALAMLRGQLHKVHQVGIETLNFCVSESMPHLAFLPHIRLGRTYYFWNRLAEAEAHIRQGLQTPYPPEYMASIANGLVNLSLLHQARGETSQALETLAEVKHLAQKLDFAGTFARAQGLEAQYHIAAGNMDAALRWAKETGWASYQPSDPKVLYTDEGFIASLLLALADQQQSHNLDALLTWKQQDAGREHRTGVLLDVLIVRMKLERTRQRPATALAYLYQALQIAEREDLVRPFLDLDPQCETLLRRVPRTHPTSAYARTLLSHFPRTHPPIHNLLEPMSEQELHILQLMAQGYSNPQIAKQRMLAVSTVRWYAKQIFRKLGVNNRTQAATQARKLNLL